jgi:2'-5' RNA ligase
MDRTRTFVALPVSAAVKQLAAHWMQRLGQVADSVKWVATENLHLTLKFLGEVPSVELAEICQRVTSAVAALQPLEIECDHVGAFPNSSHPRTLWLGIGAGSQQVSQLQESVERGLNQLGFRREQRQYHPHVTLGRLRSSPASSPELTSLLEPADFGTPVTCLVEQVVVVASQKSREGPHYQRLATIPLGRIAS